MLVSDLSQEDEMLTSRVTPSQFPRKSFIVLNCGSRNREALDLAADVVQGFQSLAETRFSNHIYRFVLFHRS